DTRTLKPLEPLYVSTVDSGNLAGSVVVLKQGLESFGDLPVIPMNMIEGLRDTANVLMDAVEKAEKVPQEVKNTAGDILKILSSADNSPRGIREVLNRTVSLAAGIGACGWSDRKGEVSWWAGELERNSTAWISDMDLFIPWASGKSDADQRPLTGVPGLKEIPTFRDLALLKDDIPDVLLVDAALRAREMLSRAAKLAAECGQFTAPEFELLFDKSNDLLTIGYNVSERKADQGYYDLLASESRIASFVGIASGQLPQEHWFAMGRQLTAFKGDPVLISWSGSMFEYLMPLLIMPTYDGTLLDATYKAAVRGQIAYASERGVPWGISESGYNTTDAQMNYQYRAFGVPDLGFKRGLVDDLVIAPYASVLALMVKLKKACANLVRMEEEGFLGKYGFYEAVDYTPTRLPHGQSMFAVVRSFMSHHQGMSLLALAYSLLDKPMQRRFLADPAMAAAEVLLQERVPKARPFHPRSSESYALMRSQGEKESLFRVFTTPGTPVPEVHFLSNGRYTVLVTNSGAGYSRWNDMMITRWKEDTTCDAAGMFFYVRDAYSGETWSVGYHPTRRMPRHYEAIFSQGKAEFRRTDRDMNTHAEFAVSPEDDIELRRIRLTNRSRARRVIELTSYAEVVLAAEGADNLHPAFSKLFVSTEILSEKQAIMCRRRKRSKEDPSLEMFQLVAIHGVTEGEVSYETDRARFLGRCNTPAEAEAMKGPSKLSGSQGSVLDPIVSLRCRVVLEPDETATVDFVTGIGESRQKALELIEKYRDKNLADRVFDLAWTHGQVVLQHFNATEADAQIFGRLAGSIVYPSHLRRVGPTVIAKNRRGQSGLWGYGISGDLPIALVRITDQANIDLVRQMIKAHAYWRMKGLKVDLIIWN
ncbi:MAG: glucoamylase family protein, partial [Candidatus Omnitrophica bacterium]|nr:glucoamylase family protein [Candidatus Omnitrophota bacterium]